MAVWFAMLDTDARYCLCPLEVQNLPPDLVRYTQKRIHPPHNSC